LALKVDHVSRKLGAFSLRDISLEVAEGEYFVLLGPTGAGKTVLLEVVMGFRRPDEGRIFLNDQDITNMRTEKRVIGYVPQNCPLFPHLSVSENVEFGLKMQRMAHAERKKTVHRMLEIMHLEALAGRMPLSLSGGEKQKAVLARVLATGSKVILLDEPLTAIDAETSRSLRDELRRINNEFGVAFLHVTHDQIEAFSLADRVGVMREGKILQVGVPSGVLSNPADESVARFLGYENVFHVKSVSYEGGINRVSIGDAQIKLKGKLENAVATIAIRPEDVAMMTEAPAASDNWNFFEGTVEEYTNLGPVVEVTVDSGLMWKVLIDKWSFLELNLSKGKRVYVLFRADSVKIVSQL
jgi:molybdate/tungstate transport system ATP-binding protein